MNQITPQKILEEITKFYLSSNDFNGISADKLAGEFETILDEILEPISNLISEDL